MALAHEAVAAGGEHLADLELALGAELGLAWADGYAGPIPTLGFGQGAAAECSSPRKRPPWPIWSWRLRRVSIESTPTTTNSAIEPNSTSGKTDCMDAGGRRDWRDWMDAQGSEIAGIDGLLLNGPRSATRI